MSRLRPLVWLLLVVVLGLPALAHEHEMEAPGPFEMNFRNEEEIDKTLKLHIAFQTISWGLIFPAGMVLGINKSRWHVPWQLLGITLSLVGNYLGHHHKGRMFHQTAHEGFAKYLWWYLISQAVLGTILKLHIGQQSTWRRYLVLTHGVIGKTFPVVGWSQMVLGGIAALGFCFGEHLGQCLAHFIMGSAFIGYALLLLLMLRVGAGWLARKRLSQEYLDSCVIMFWGIVNTFTMHNFFGGNGGWSHKDLQHTSLGVLWWAGGALGILLGRNGKRNIIPAVIITMTGFAMSAHAQSLEFSTKVHQLFGFALMSVGAARLIEICFVLQDQASPPSNSTKAFQHLPPFLLVLSGLTFMSATEEQVSWVAGTGMDSVTYANILFSASFLVYLTGCALLELYERTIPTSEDKRELDSERIAEEGNARGGAGSSWMRGINLPFLRSSNDDSRTRGRTNEGQVLEYEALPLVYSDLEERMDGRSRESSGS